MNTTQLRSTFALFGVLGASLAAAPAHAQITITSVNPAVQSINRGGTTTFTATLKNTGASTFYFLGDNTDFTMAPGPTEFGAPTATNTVALDDTPFFNSVLAGASLASGASQTFTLFNIFAGTASTPGSYLGYFTIQGNTDPNGAANDLVTQNFQATVNSPVPEASTTVSLGLLLALGVGGALIASRKKKAQAAA